MVGWLPFPPSAGFSTAPCPLGSIPYFRVPLTRLLTSPHPGAAQNPSLMKKFFTLRAAALLLTCTSVLALDAQLLQQDFSASTSTATYVSATPNNGQFDALGVTAGTAVSINTTGSNKLEFVRTGGSGGFSRITDFSPTPTSLIVRFDLTLSGNSVSATTGATWWLGSGLATTNSGPANANVHSRVGLNVAPTAGSFGLRDIGGGTNSAIYSGTQTITWVVNNSGATMTYRTPSGIEESVANDTWDLWVGTTKEFNDIAATTAAQTLTDFKFLWTNGSATVDHDNFLVDPIPATPTSAAALPINQTNFQANWSTVAGVTGYSIDVSTSPTFASFLPGYNNLYVAGQATN